MRATKTPLLRKVANAGSLLKGTSGRNIFYPLDQSAAPLFGFLPNQSNLAFWLRNGMGLYQDTGIVTPANATDPIGDWLDQSGNGRNFTQSAGLRPTRQSVTFGGKTFSEARFDGSDDVLSGGNLAALDFERTDPFSIFSIIRPISAASANIISKQLSGTTFAGWALQFNLAADRKLYVSLTANFGATQYLRVNGSTALTLGQPYAVVATSDGTGLAAGVKIYVNGVAETMTMVQDTLGANSIKNAAVVALGSRNAADLPFPGGLSETGIYAGLLSATQISQVSLYLGRISGAY